MGKLLVYLKDYKKESVLGPLFKLLEASFELIVPLVMAAIIDHGVADGDKPYIMKMCLVLVLLAVIGLTCSITAQYFAAKAAVGFSTGLRHALFEHIQKLSFSEMDTVGTSTLITRMTSDINQTQNGVNLVLRLFLRSPFIVFGAMIMAFTIDVKAALVFVVTIPLLSVVVFGIMLVSIPLYKKVQSALDKVLGITRENLTGSRVIRAFNKENDEITNFNESNDALTKIQLYVGKISALMNPLTYVIINGAVVVLVWTGAIRVNSGYITQGEVVALVNYMSQILVELIKLANLLVTITKALASADRIKNVFEQKSTLEHNFNDKKSNSYIEFDNVSLKYRNAGDMSLIDISFKADKGDVIGIIGSTGSGKSSLVSLVPHFYDATKGTVYVNGNDVKSLNDDELRNKIGFVQQKAVLFKGSVRDNMKWGKKDATDAEIIEALKLAQVYDTIMEKGGLDFFIAQGGANLSGGQKQRLSVARALVRKPEILVLDDSSSALDFATEARLREAIYSLDYNPTVFIVSQRASSVMSADKIIVLDDGKCVGMGTHSELLNSCEVYKEIYVSQFGKEEA